jgi:hypothetical protein
MISPWHYPHLLLRNFLLSLDCCQGNALTLNPTPTITAVTAGMTLRFQSGATPNSGATTVAIGSAAAIAVQSSGAACVGGEIAANLLYQITVDASLTACQLSKIGLASYADLGAYILAESVYYDVTPRLARQTCGNAQTIKISCSRLMAAQTLHWLTAFVHAGSGTASRSRNVLEPPRVTSFADGASLTVRQPRTHDAR